MQRAKEHFDNNIIRVKNLGAIYQIVNKEITLDLSDILRSQYVMLISALDHFIHEIVRIGMIEIYNKNRRDTKEFKAFIFSLDKNILFNKAIMEDKNNQWLDYQIRLHNSYKSFQQAEKIKEALKLIDKMDLWNEISRYLNINKEDLTKQLNLIIDRRNQITHEADIEPTYQELRDIKVEDINDSIDFIEKIVNSIFILFKNER